MSMRIPPVIFKRGASIDEFATHFVRILMRRPVSQLRIRGPNSLLFSSQACHFADDLAKNHADSNKHGVPGNIGKKNPISPVRGKRNRRVLGAILSSAISFPVCLLEWVLSSKNRP